MRGVDMAVVLATALQIASTLEHLHARNILHCNLSKGTPSHTLLRRDRALRSHTVAQ